MPIFFLLINVALMYIVLWAAANQIVKLQTQRMSIFGENLNLSRGHLSMSWPLIRHSELEIPLQSVRSFSLQNTRIGYLLTIRFQQDNKLMGMDLDINPLRTVNRDVLRRVTETCAQVEIDEATEKILEDFEKRMLSWKTHFVFSMLLIGLAIAIFFVISVFLGIKGG